MIETRDGLPAGVQNDAGLPEGFAYGFFNVPLVEYLVVDPLHNVNDMQGESVARVFHPPGGKGGDVFPGEEAERVYAPNRIWGASGRWPGTGRGNRLRHGHPVIGGSLGADAADGGR